MAQRAQLPCWAFPPTPESLHNFMRRFCVRHGRGVHSATNRRLAAQAVDARIGKSKRRANLVVCHVVVWRGAHSVRK